MVNYKDGKIYTIRCRNDDKLIYVGSTTQPLYKRWGKHKTDSKKKPDRLIYKTINNDFDNWYIELYENYPCDKKEQLLKKEGEIIRSISNLNMEIAGRTKREYYYDNADKFKELAKQYRNVNKEKVSTQRKIYRENNEEKLKEQRKKCYEENSQIRKQKMKQNYQDNKEKRLEYMRQYYQQKKEEKAEQQQQ